MFKLFDKDENYISSIENVTSARHIEEINGEDSLELSLIEKELTESEKAKEVDKLYGLPEGTMEGAGRNLLRDTSNEWEKVVLGSWNRLVGLPISATPEETYTFRVEYRNPIGIRFTVRIFEFDESNNRQESGDGTFVEIGKQGYSHVTITTLPTTKTIQAVIRANSRTGGEVEYRCAKLEKTTPWLEEQLALEGRNLIVGSDTYIDRGSRSFNIAKDVSELNGKTVTSSVDIEVENAQIGETFNSRRIGFEFGLMRADGTKDYYGAWKTLSEGETFKGRISKTFNLPNRDYVEVSGAGIYVQILGGLAKCGRPKLEFGSTAKPWNPALEEVIPWTPAPEDVDIKPRETIKKGYKIAHKTEYGHWKEFVVKEVEEMHATEGIEKRIYCESSFYETIGDYIEDRRPSGTANSALAVALEPTRWEVGTVDNLGVNATNFYQISVKEAVQKIAETWEAEIQTRVTVVGNKITHRYVDLLAKRGGDFGKRFTYSKNLESVSKIVHRDDVITALYGYGKGEEVGDGYGRRIDFADVNNGKAYVENNEAKEVWGRNNSDGTKSHVFSRVYFDDVEEKDLLLSLTQKKLEEVSKPLVTYQCSVASFEGIDLGDRVKIIDTEFSPELRLAARVVKIYRDLLEKDRSVVLLGNFIPTITNNLARQEQYINNIRSKEGVYDRADIINADGTLDAQFLNNLVNELNLKMNSQGGYVFVSENGKGLITTNAPTIAESTMAIQLLGGAFRIANSKLSNGEFNWKTFGDGNGFVADSFIGGLLKGGKVNFDLTNGTLLIGDSTTDYSLYFDGSTLRLGGDAVITWDNLSEDSKVNLKGEDGKDGYTPIKGTDYFDGKDGQDGESQYLWIMYSQNSDGSLPTDNPTDAKYIGVATTITNVKPTNYLSYSWSLIKGQDGQNGVKGEVGDDGKTSYLHIKYSDNGTSFTSNNGETVGKWIGTYVDFIEADSMRFSKYTWNKVKGEDGKDGYTPIKGTDYFDGKDGQDGKSKYLWIKYSQNSDGSSPTDNPTDAKYIGVATTLTNVKPTSYSSYSWSLIKGQDGKNGIKGEVGDDGRTSYLHIKYSNNGTTFTANNGERVGSWIGTYVDFVEADSMRFSKYTWNKVKGEDGKDGSDANVPSYITNTKITQTTIESPSITGGVVTGAEINNGNGTFRVDADGNLTATNADISGEITAGTFLIGESTEDYLIYFDGTNLNFAQGREYTWEDIDADNKTWNDLDADNKTWLEVIRSPLYNPYQLTHDLGVLESDFGRTLSLISDEETLDLMERAIGGKTLIKGGYINTQLVAAQSILANMIKVNDLSAISANIGTVIAGLLKSANGESYFDLSNNKLVTNNADITGGSINITTSDDYSNVIKLSSPNVYSITAPGQFKVRNSEGRFSSIEGHGAYFGSYSGGLRTDNVAISCSSGKIQTNGQIKAKDAIFTDDQIQAKGSIFTDNEIHAEGSIFTDKQLAAGNRIYENYMLSIYGGNAYISGSLSAKTIIDRTPYYDGNALEELSRVKDDGNGGIDHSTLPKFAQIKINQEVSKPKSGTSEVMGIVVNETLGEKRVVNTQDVLDNSNATSMELQREEKTKEVEGRDIGAMVSVLTKAIQQLISKNEEQDILINELQKTLKEVKHEEGIDNNNITDNNHRHI